jgi:hypothetical protein
MKKKNLNAIVAFILPIALSFFLCFNYINTVNSGVRISSEVGYYIFLILIVIASILFSILQQGLYSRRSVLKNALQISFILLLCVSLDMFLHIVAREFTHSQNTSSILSGGFQINITLIKSAWRIFGVRFLSILLIGNLLFWGITWLRHNQSS